MSNIFTEKFSGSNSKTLTQLARFMLRIVLDPIDVVAEPGISRIIIADFHLILAAHLLRAAQSEESNN